MDPVFYVVLIFACLLASAFFSGSETALMRLRSSDVDKDVQEGRGPAIVAVRDMLRSTSRLLVTILIGNNVVNILGSAAAAALAIHYLGEERGIVAATLIMTVLVLLFAEVLPKAVAAQHPRAVAYAVGLPLYFFHGLIRPLHWLFDLILRPLINVLGGTEGESHSAEEVLRLARLQSVDQPHATPLAIIGSAVGAADRTVEEILVPRTEIVAFPVGTPPDALLEKVLAERYTRVPIYEETIDQVLGVVHLKDLIQLNGRSGNGLHGILKPVLRVPERKPILRLLADMQRAFVHVAIVKDEFGVTQGMVTQEDILEEIVGEIRDEFDREELLAIRPVGDQFQSLGRVSVLDFNRETGWDVPFEPGDTLSGLVFNSLGRGPNVGDEVRAGDYELRVEDVSGSRITRVRVARLDESEKSEANGERS